jgi:hypothetical protein
MIAIDTNLLVYAHRARTPEHARARKAIERAAADDAGWGIAAASLTEFWAVAWSGQPDLRAGPHQSSHEGGCLTRGRRPAFRCGMSGRTTVTS